MLESIFRYYQAVLKKPRDEFLAKYTDPVFIVSHFTEEDKEGKRTRLKTRASDESFVPFSVARVAKREGVNPFKSMITIGRGQANDICIPVPQISKTHAYIETGERGELSITDAGSTNGTRVRGLWLDKKVSVPLEDGDEVVLGVVICSFHTPEGFYAFLRQVGTT